MIDFSMTTTIIFINSIFYSICLSKSLLESDHSTILKFSKINRCVLLWMEVRPYILIPLKQKNLILIIPFGLMMNLKLTRKVIVGLFQTQDMLIKKWYSILFIKIQYLNFFKGRIVAFYLLDISDLAGLIRYQGLLKIKDWFKIL